MLEALLNQHQLVYGCDFFQRHPIKRWSGE
jgi:hypothetical protein